MKKLITSTSVFLLTVFILKAQVGIGTNNPNTSAVLELKSQDKGFLLPSVDPAKINNPAEGLLIYNTAKNCISAYENGYWRCLSLVNSLVEIPDANFRKYLKGIIPEAFPNGGDKMDRDHNEVKTLTEISVISKSINSLEGIQYFTALTKLKCYNNNLKHLDLTNNTALIELNCSYNKLTTLSLGNSPYLEKLNFMKNSLSIIENLNLATGLLHLNGSYNSTMRSLDLSKNVELRSLDMQVNATDVTGGLRSLDLSKNCYLKKQMLITPTSKGNRVYLNAYLINNPTYVRWCPNP